MNSQILSLYYWFGFSLLVTGLVTTVIGCQTKGIGKVRQVTSVALVAIALALMVVDYLWIYGPLREMSADPPRVPTLTFCERNANPPIVGIPGGISEQMWSGVDGLRDDVTRRNGTSVDEAPVISAEAAIASELRGAEELND